MREGRAHAAVLVAIMLAGLGICPSAGAEGVRQVGGQTFTSTVPGAPTGNSLRVDFQNPDDPTQKPYSVATMVIHVPPGTVIDTTVPPQCHATDAEIYAEGPAACPSDTQIGSGLAVTDNGAGSPPDSRYGHSDLTHFNNQDEIVGIGVTRESPRLTTIDRTKIANGTSTSTFPLFPGFPPPEPYTPVKSLSVDIGTYVRSDGATYMRTPPTCPDSGYWTFRIDFNYRDGVTQTVESHSPCDRGRPRP